MPCFLAARNVSIESSHLIRLELGDFERLEDVADVVRRNGASDLVVVEDLDGDERERLILVLGFVFEVVD